MEVSAQLYALKVVELQELLRARKLKVSGLKSELVARLAGALGLPDEQAVGEEQGEQPPPPPANNVVMLGGRKGKALVGK